MLLLCAALLARVAYRKRGGVISVPRSDRFGNDVEAQVFGFFRTRLCVCVTNRGLRTFFRTRLA